MSSIFFFQNKMNNCNIFIKKKKNNWLKLVGFLYDVRLNNEIIKKIKHDNLTKYF